MKRLFLLPAIALFIVLAVSSVSASGCCQYKTVDGCGPNNQWPCYYCHNADQYGNCPSDPNYLSYSAFYYCNTNQEYCCDINGENCVPEFTTIGAGLALMGAGAGYLLIRKKRK